MKIMTYNIQHGANCLFSGEINLDGVVEVLKKYEPVIVGLNEVRGEGPRKDYTAQTEYIAEKAGYPYFFYGPAIMVDGKNPYGNAILSKYPIVSAEAIKIPDAQKAVFGTEYESRNIVKAKIDLGGKIITVLATHFGLYPDEIINAIYTAVENFEGEKCIIMGDFNLTPDSPFITAFEFADKFVDTANVTEELLYTYPSHKPDRKIDYMFVSRDIAVKSVTVPQTTQSDHTPYLAELEF
jgi:endonuclease/exonuclease/phosphatase family metal-dependent hydrolase